MRSIIEFSKPSIRFEFFCRCDKQKILIEMLLKYSELNLAGLASILNISIGLLQDVYVGADILRGKPADHLLQLFLIFLSE